MPTLKNADKAFEYFLLISTILQSILLQLLTYLLKPDEQKYAIAFAAVFFFPYLLALITWIYAIVETYSIRAIGLRIIAWASTEAGLFLNMVFFLLFFSLRAFEINIDLGTWMLIGTAFFTTYLSKVTGKILEEYRNASETFNIWNPRFGRLGLSDAYITHNLVFVYVSVFLVLVLIIWTS